MDFNIKTYAKTNPFKLLSVAFMGAILIILVISSISYSGENKRLKSTINKNLEKINKLESQKNTIFESVKIDSILLIEKNNTILNLSKKEDSLINNLKHFKNERIKIKNAYFNNDVNERIRIFSKLANGTKTD